MILSIKTLLNTILSMNRFSKRFFAIITDIFLCIFCTWLAFSLRFEELVLLNSFDIYAALLSVILALPIFWIFGLYKIIFRYTNLSIIFNISTSILVYGLFYFLVIGIYGFPSKSNYYSIVPRSIGIIQPMLLFFAIISSRLVVKFLAINNSNFKKFSKKKNVLVYGAGDAGRQLVLAL